jgi:diguanylate cyclase (GGDEF)-like protein
MGPSVRSGRGLFLGVTGALTVAMPMLPTAARPWVVLLVAATTAVAVGSLVARTPAAHRTPWTILLGSLVTLTVSNAVNILGGPAQRVVAETLLAVAHAAMLAGSVSLVRRRGRHDTGSLLDLSVAGITFGGLVWTTLLLPRLDALGVADGQRIPMLVSILVLAGVLGALGRLWFTAERRPPALGLLCASLLSALVGNVVLAMATGSMTTGDDPNWMQSFFLAAYVCVGLVGLHPSARELAMPAPAPADRLTTGRLVFLGAALSVNPVAVGVRQILGLPVDGILLAIGCLLVVPLVLIRIGRLAGEREAAEAALHHQATHDRLTGLPNRAELRDRLDAALRRERAAGRPSVGLIFCDLDGFKDVNDRLGHAAGDALLIEVGVRLRAGLRATDTLARYGGDEFLVLAVDGAPEDAVRRLRAHVGAALAAPFHLAGEPVRIGASVGCAVSAGGIDAEELIGRADQAMYTEKQRRPVPAR